MVQDSRSLVMGMAWGTLLSVPLWISLIGWYQILLG